MMTEGVALLPVECGRRTYTIMVVGAMTPLALVLSDPQNVLWSYQVCVFLHDVLFHLLISL